MSPIDTIHDWFNRNTGGSLMLPNGWFGRPYDNIHQLADVCIEGDGMTIWLDGGQFLLRFEGVPRLSEDKNGLEFSNFRHLRFEWKEYGSNLARSESFDEGMVKVIVAP